MIVTKLIKIQIFFCNGNKRINYIDKDETGFYGIQKNSIIQNFYKKKNKINHIIPELYCQKKVMNERYRNRNHRKSINQFGKIQQTKINIMVSLFKRVIFLSYCIFSVIF